MYTNTLINEMSALFIDAYERAGYARISISAIESLLKNLTAIHIESGSRFFDERLANSFVSRAKDRYETGKIVREYYLFIKRTVSRLSGFCKTGELDYRPIYDTKFNVAPDYLSLLNRFAENSEWSDATRYHVRYTAKHHFEWLTDNNISTAGDVTPNILREYLGSRSERLSGWGMKDAMFSLKKMYRFLFENGYSSATFEELLSFSVSVTKRFKPSLPDNEIAKMFEAINRESGIGKRNYAILLLAYITGLRASDIAALKLADIDWVIGEMRLIQKKTSNPLVLPLTKDVGQAIKDYILNARSITTTQRIFLTSKSPFSPLISSGITSIYKSVRKQAGLEKEPFDGKSFHAFRRTVGKNMVVAGIPITDIAQILGHTDIESTKDYIPLDKDSMKSCALEFDGIQPLSQIDANVYEGCALDLKGFDPDACKERTLCCALDFAGIEWRGGISW